MGRVYRILISRRTAVGLIAALLVLTALGYVVPQDNVLGGEPNRLGLPGWALAAASMLGFDRMFSSASYLGLLGVCVLSLVAAMVHQGGVLKRRWRPSVAPAGGVPVAADPDEVGRVLARHGYRRAADVGKARRYVKHGWALWGGFVLHVGLVLATAAALMVLATESWAVVGLTEGERFEPGAPWSNEDPGPWGAPIVLSDAMIIEAIDAEYWPTHAPKQLSSTLAFEAPDGPEERLRIAVNHSRVRDGIRFYQEQRYGHAFFVVITMPDGSRDLRQIDMKRPSEPAQASYEDVTLADGSVLQWKYYADAARRDMNGTPQLWARQSVAGQAGESARLDPGVPTDVGAVSVELDRVAEWTTVVAVRHRGIGVLFAGFFVVFLGSAMIYSTATREAFVRVPRAGREDGPGHPGPSIRLRAARFADMYRDEFDAILTELHAEETR